MKQVICIVALVLLVLSCGQDNFRNTPPIPHISFSPPNGTIETIFTFDATGSTDAQDSLADLQFRWDFEADGTWDTDWSHETSKRKRYLEADVYQINLEVLDSDGAIAISTAFVEVDAFILVDLRDNQQYLTIQIGSQLWMAENLNYDSQPGSWCHSDSDQNCRTYGRLYDWYTAQFVCPSGWKLPTTADFDQLISFVGEYPGDQLRADHGWNAGHNGNNSSGFTALPASFRSSVGSFSKIGSFTYFWEVDEFDQDMAWSRLLFYNRSDVEHNYQNKANAFSVRCIKAY